MCNYRTQSIGVEAIQDLFGQCDNGLAGLYAGNDTDKPKVLAACPPPAFQILSRAVGGDVDLLYTNSLSAARSLLRTHPELALVVCGIHFDESRMYDLLTEVQRDFASLPFLAVRIMDYEAAHMSLQPTHTALQALGALGVIDFPSACKANGAIEADRQLRDAVMNHLYRT